MLSLLSLLTLAVSVSTHGHYQKGENILDIVIEDCSGSTCKSGDGWTKIDQSVGTSQYLSYKVGQNSSVIVDISVGASRPGYVDKGHGLYVKYGNPRYDQAITGIDVLFGTDAVDPRPDWALSSNSLDTTADKKGPSYLTIRKKEKDYPTKSLSFNGNGKFKIMQVADTHFSTGVGACRDPVPASSAEGCKADPRTIELFANILDIEKPDFIVFTGDQVYGPTAPDAKSALFKVFKPFIDRKIPFASVLGNHDQESSLTRQQSQQLSVDLPYSLSEVGPDSITGFGNYVLTVGSSKGGSGATFYFLDSGDYSKDSKYPGYGWIHEDQLDYIGNNLKQSPLTMAFFHIPLPEYDVKNNLVGTRLESVSAPTYNSKSRDRFGEWGVQVTSCGHDHLNDYCYNSTNSKDSVMLCYGGGGGEGGYGGKGFTRRFRLYELDENEGTITTWKRGEADTSKVLDQEVVYKK